MAKKKIPIYPGMVRELVGLGQRLKQARLRRRFSMELVCTRADLSRPTLSKIEKGDPSVSLGSYLQVLRVLGLVSDISHIAENDELGRRLQDDSLPQAKRAPRRRKPAE
ncbi:MAG: helix-turn-helix domain-containing protein [Planctomycetota bacterium]|jgi:transcriptional regulator with XRE-family HTH domain